MVASDSRYRPPLMIEPSWADRPIPPRIAKGVPAAIPHAPATIMTEIVERTLWVTRNVTTAAPRAK